MARKGNKYSTENIRAFAERLNEQVVLNLDTTEINRLKMIVLPGMPYNDDPQIDAVSNELYKLAGNGVGIFAPAYRGNLMNAISDWLRPGHPSETEKPGEENSRIIVLLPRDTKLSDRVLEYTSSNEDSLRKELIDRFIEMIIFQLPDEKGRPSIDKTIYKITSNNRSLNESMELYNQTREIDEKKPEILLTKEYIDVLKIELREDQESAAMMARENNGILQVFITAGFQTADERYTLLTSKFQGPHLIQLPEAQPQ